MQIEKHHNATIAIVRSDTVVINDGQEAAEFAYNSCACRKIIFSKKVFPEAFFDILFSNVIKAGKYSFCRTRKRHCNAWKLLNRL